MAYDSGQWFADGCVTDRGRGAAVDSLGIDRSELPLRLPGIFDTVKDRRCFRRSREAISCHPKDGIVLLAVETRRIAPYSIPGSSTRRQVGSTVCCEPLTALIARDYYRGPTLTSADPKEPRT